MAEQKPNLNVNRNTNISRFEPYTTKVPEENEREYIESKDVPQEVIDKVNNFKPNYGPSVSTTTSTSTKTSSSANYNVRSANYSSTPNITVMNGSTNNVNTFQSTTKPGTQNFSTTNINSSPANINQQYTCSSPVSNSKNTTSTQSSKDKATAEAQKTQPKTTPAPDVKSADDLMKEYNELKNACVIGRKEVSEGTEGFLYNIKYIIKNMENVRLEGRILYEQFVDIEKYKQDVTKTFEELDKIKKDLASNSEKLSYDTGYRTSNSQVFAGATAEKYHQNIIQTEDSFNEMYQKAKDLYDNLADDVKQFETFNHYLSILKYATQLNLLIGIVEKINAKKTILSGKSKTYTTYKILPPWWKAEYTKGETNTQYTQVKETVKKTAMYEKSLITQNNQLEADKTVVNVLETTYLRIKLDNLKMVKKSSGKYTVKVSKNDNPESYKADVVELENRITAAKNESQIPYGKSTNMIMEVK